MIEILNLHEHKIDFSVFTLILSEASLRIRRKGLPMWNPELLTEESLLVLYRLEDIFILFFDGRPAGAFVLQDSDDDYWGADSSEHGAMYIHKVAVADGFTGMNLVDEMVEFAAGLTKKMNKTKLRLDCLEHRVKVRPIYEKNGFVLRDIRPVHGSAYCLYERVLLNHQA